MKQITTLILLVMMSITAKAGDEPLQKITGQNISFSITKAKPRKDDRSITGPALLVSGLVTAILGGAETNSSYYTVQGGSNSPSGSYPYTGTKVYKPFLQQWPRNILVIGGASAFVIGFVITLKH